MLSEYHRALATCCVLKQQLEKEQTARKAMAICIQDIKKKLDRYKGHLIDRIRFHIDHHQTEYVRKVRVQNYQKENLRRRQRESKAAEQRPKRVAVTQLKDVDDLRALLAERDEQIEALCLLIENGAPAAPSPK